MGRRKKKNTANNIKVFFIGLILTGLVASGVYYGLKYWTPGDEIVNIPDKNEQVKIPPADDKKPEETSPEQPKQEEYVNIFFIGKNEHNEEVYRAVKRVYNKDVDGSKIKYAITSLILGPTSGEKSKGVYTELPTGTKLLGITEKPDKVIINLSDNFVAGGGTESVYKRLYQLIKTSKRNTQKAVFLYINGQQADVIGGDGIMITQPLNENSLD